MKVVQQFYDGLNAGDYQKVSSVLSDKFIMRENEGNFEVSFSPDKFHDWFQWDSVFNPTYEILSSERINDTLRLAISKKCDRIMLFNKVPIRYLAFFEISNGKLNAVNRYSYLGTNWEKWTQKKEKFLQFVHTEIPEYNDMEEVQDYEHGEKYAKAIQLFNFYVQNPIVLKTPQVKIKTVNLKFDKNGDPSGEYYLFYNNGKDSLLIDKEYSGKLITPEEYSNYNIPENALTALESYWAGIGLIHFVVKSDSNLTIFKCVFDEMDVAEAKEGDNPYRYDKFKIIRIK